MYDSDVKAMDSDDIVYYRERNRNKVYAAVVSLFSKLVETERLTKREIAFRLGKEPAQITRWLSGPSNWTLDTVSDLLLAMGRELDYKVSSVDSPKELGAEHPLLREHISSTIVVFPGQQKSTRFATVQSGTNKPAMMAKVDFG